MRILLALGLLVVGCRTQLLAPSDGGAPVDLGGAPSDLAAIVDLAQADLVGHACGAQTCGSNQGCVIPCCGGAGPQCMPAPDGGCVAPLQPCPFGGTGCYLPCTPPAPFCVDLPSACVTNPGSNLCACITKNGRPDPCLPGGGGTCANNIINLPPGQVMCLCF